ncbi:hypothetical protein FSPOR_4746 [Fusarium sporotrichioides]|uniref:Uncharacterized protein n=1 Tax=Fusarium sporotrichioides TaxID=5514 RepID=A0A395SB07_FUSSP|nr:hypothetical protein FSPOR_4746 [Fusarium sporotrichioides]
MSSRQPSEATPSQRERDLSTQLQEAASEKHALLKQLLDAKCELLEASRQREQNLSNQLKRKISELEAADAQKENLTTQLEKHAADLATLKKHVDDPHIALLEKKTALQASRRQERELALELQTVKADFASYKASEKYQEDRLEQAEKDLKRFNDRSNILASQVQEIEDARKGAEDLAEQLQQAREKIKMSEIKTAQVEKELQKSKAEVEAALVREKGLRSRLSETNRFTFGRQTPPVVFGAPSPIPGTRQITPFGHPAPKSEQVPPANPSSFKQITNKKPQEKPSFFGSPRNGGRLQEISKFSNASTKPSTPAQNPWKPLPPVENAPPQQGQITNFGGS